MEPNTLSTQPIGRTLASAAAEALGGAPARPPVPRAANRNSPDQAAARQAFKEAHTVAAPAAPVLIGHPTFDPVPDALGLRREKVAVLRLRLSLLAKHILEETAALQPLISELEPEAADVLASELFSTAIAQAFLGSLSQTVAALSEKPEEDSQAK